MRHGCWRVWHGALYPRSSPSGCWERRTVRQLAWVRSGRGANWRERNMLESRIVEAVRAIVGPDGMVTADEETRTYESDGLAALRQKPELVALPTTTEQVAALVKLCYDERIPFVPRGSGTGLS